MKREADTHHGVTVRRACIALTLLLCALFLASVARFYHPGVGFSALLIIPKGYEDAIPAVRNIPHYEYPAGEAYDGALYVQLAMDPLLRDPAIDRALDAPAYRARRILFCWTAYALGLGKPSWILQAYALQNVLFWLLLAWLLTRWLPPRTPKLVLLWAASMFSHGLLISVRMALLDGPSLLLIALAVACAERGHTWLTAATVGVAGLGRETNLLAAVVLPRPIGRKGWLKAIIAGIIVLLPLIIWQDYIWSIYRGTSASAGVDQLTVPFSAYLEKLRITRRAVRIHGFASPAGYTLLVLISLTVQAVFLIKTRAVSHPWWRLAAAYLVLMFLVHPVVWDGYPGAITRVVLPMKFGFNILLAATAPTRFLTWFTLGNLDLVAALHVGVPPPF